MVIGLDETTLRRYDHKIGYTYYNMEIRDVNFSLLKCEKHEKPQGNPFGKRVPSQVTTMKSYVS